MFTKVDKNADRQPPAPAPQAAAPNPGPAEMAKPAPRSDAVSVISSDVTILGNVQSQGDIQIDGKVKGDIKSRMVTIGESAQIEGSIFAETARIFGTVTGQVSAKTVMIAKTARMIGDIIHQSLAVEQGAFLESHCRRMDANGNDPRSQRPAGAPATPATAPAAAAPAAAAKPAA